MRHLPSWLSAKNLYIAENLITQGFHYCGHADNFCGGYFLEGTEDWDIFSPYGESGLDLVCDKALFSLEFADSELTSQLSAEQVLEHAKKLISLFSYQWDHDSPVHRQLELLAA